MESHLLQMRGLKPFVQQWRAFGVYVASFTDAWIETSVMSRLRDAGLVASFTDAWIETVPSGIRSTSPPSHLLQMRGLKLTELLCDTCKVKSHLLQMRGLKRLPLTLDARTLSRIFYRCVD